jgi:hypothetical protein
MKRDELSNRIWRTVVFSGAMLGAPLASADKAPQGKPAPVRPADTVESLTKELDANMVTLLASIDAVLPTLARTDRKGGHQLVLVSRSLDDLRKARHGLQARLAKLPKPPPPIASIAKLQRKLADHDVKLLAGVAAVTAATSEADQFAAYEKLAELRKARTPIEASLEAEIEKQKRPRTPDADRPTGRGFILS